MPTTMITDVLKSVTQDVVSAVDDVLDTLAGIEGDGRTFAADTRKAGTDFVTNTKDVARDLATSTRDSAQRFAADSRDEAASYTSEVRDDVESVATDARGTAHKVAGDIKANVLQSTRDSLENVRSNGARLSFSRSSASSDEVAELKATVAALTKAVAKLTAKK